MFNKYYLHIIAGGVIYSLSLLASCFAPVIEVLHLTLGFGVGFANSLLAVAVFAIIPYYFEERLGMATGLMQAGAGIGLFIFSALNAYLISMYGLQGSLLILSSVALHAIPLGIVMKMPLLKEFYQKEQDEIHTEIANAENERKPLLTEVERKPLLTDAERKPLLTDAGKTPSLTNAETKPQPTDEERRSLLSDSERKPLLANAEGNVELSNLGDHSLTLNKDVEKDTTRNINCIELKAFLSITGLDLFKNKYYSLLILATTFITLSHKSVPTIIPDHIAWTGATKLQASNSLVYIGIANTLSRLFSWKLSKNEVFRTIDVLTISSFLSGATLACTVFYNRYWMYVVLCIIYGITRGVYIIYYSLLLILIVGKERAHHGYGVGMTIKGVVILTGMSSFGALTDATYKTWGYSVVFMVIGGSEIIASVLLLVTRAIYKKENVDDKC